uniref:NACHT, LRR and PYD domains-containing protein 13-like n=1 Tax=Phallusia mammillata TaxID=59560 RepID=A0A6F9DN02_9ASCI|nr:NACHT, LRR and PYD domains-containing protein 13-like [Phallusia mammillata]
MKRKYQKMNARKKIEAEASASANQKQRRTKRKTETDIKPPKRRKVTQQKDMNKVNSALKCCLQEQELLKQAAKKHCEMRKKSFLPLYLKFAALRGNKRQLYQDYNCLPTRFKNGIVSSPTDAQLIYGLPKCTKGKVSIDITEIFGAANNIAETQAAKLPDSMQQEYLLRNKNSVTFVGQTGIGKTTLCKFITTNILSLGFKDLLDIKWLFYIVIQDVDFQTETTLVDFLLSNSCSGLCKHHKISNHVSQRILKSILQSSNIVIILDGLDRLEFPSDTPTFEDKNLSEQFKPVQFVQGIIRGTLLSNAIKILTTTQKHLKIVGHEYFPMFAIEVLGWDESSQEQACVKLCGRSKGKISNFISEHPDISAYCCNPAQGIVIYSALCNAFAAGDEMLLSSIHQIYLYCLCTSLHTTSKQSRLDVEQLALLTWNNGNLKTVDSEVLKSLENLCTKKGQINVHLLNGTNPVRFSSFLWQHLFSAFYLLFVMPLPVFKHKLQYLMLQKWQEITKFTFALCNEQLVDLLSKIASTTLDKHKWDCRKDLLHNHFCKQVRTLTSKHRNSMLKMLACFYEINDDNFLQEFFKFFPESVVVCGSFASWNVRHIEKVLSLSNKNHSLHILPSAKFLGKSFKLLLKTLKSYTIQVLHNTASIMYILKKKKKLV